MYFGSLPVTSRRLVLVACSGEKNAPTPKPFPASRQVWPFSSDGGQLPQRVRGSQTVVAEDFGKPAVLEEASSVYLVRAQATYVLLTTGPVTSELSKVSTTTAPIPLNST